MVFSILSIYPFLWLNLIFVLLFSEGLGEAYDGDIAFASALETFGGGHNDPISVAFGGLFCAGLVWILLSVNSLCLFPMQINFMSRGCALVNSPKSLGHDEVMMIAVQSKAVLSRSYTD